MEIGQMLNLIQFAEKLNLLHQGLFCSIQKIFHLKIPIYVDVMKFPWRKLYLSLRVAALNRQFIYFLLISCIYYLYLTFYFVFSRIGELVLLIHSLHSVICFIFRQSILLANQFYWLINFIGRSTLLVDQFKWSTNFIDWSVLVVDQFYWSFTFYWSITFIGQSLLLVNQFNLSVSCIDRTTLLGDQFHWSFNFTGW